MTVKIDPKLAKIRRAMLRAGGIVQAESGISVDKIGNGIARVMRRFLSQRSYEGDLADSVTVTTRRGKNPSSEVEPMHRRRQYHAGALLEYGTGPIENLPFTPIAKWAEFKGLPAGPVWLAIKTKGVTAHPFLKETLQDSESKAIVTQESVELGRNIALRLLGIKK